jgi:hypothetical protein
VALLRKILLMIVGLLLFLVGCDLPGQSPQVPSARVDPVATLVPTRGPLLTTTVAPTFTPPVPSATPNPELVGEQYVAREGVLAFRYPPGWLVEDSSDESEILVSVQTPEDAEVEGVLVINLLNATGDLTPADMRLVADRYLRNIFGEELAGLDVTYREEGDSLVATTVTERNEELVQFEVRFAPRPPFYQALILISAQHHWGQVAPVLDEMARSIAVNPGQAAAVPPLPAAVERQGEGLEVHNTSAYEAGTGSLYVVGEVVNNTGQPLEDVQVSVSLLDGAGAEVAREQWPARRHVLQPGQGGPFVVILNDPPEGWSEFRATADAIPASFYLARISTEFAVGEVEAAQPPFGSYALAGTVANAGQDARYVEVTGTLYDETGRVLAVESTTLEQDVLAAGEEAPFLITFYSKAEGEVARHEIQVEGTRVDGGG